MVLLSFLLRKQLVSARNSLYYAVQHMDQTPFLTLYSNQPWPFFSPVSKGTTVPKLVSLATTETVELQFVIDQSLALGIFLHPPSFHVACGVWKGVAPSQFPESFETEPVKHDPLCSDHWKNFFFSLQFIQNCFDFLKRLLSQGTMLLVLDCFVLFIPVELELC